MKYGHRPLRERLKILSVDVAEAIDNIVGPEDERSLPVAIDKAAIVEELIKIAHRAEDGTILKISAIARSTMSEAFNNKMTNSAVFQAGYKRYEEDAALPIVPVTDFFFRIVFSNGSAEQVAECLAGMTDIEIMQSLPKTKSRGRKEVDGVVEWIRDSDTGEVLMFGELAGIIVFPANSHSEILRAWLVRRSNNASGQLQKTVSKIEYARPAAEAVKNLKEQAGMIRPSMTKALPRR